MFRSLRTRLCCSKYDWHNNLTSSESTQIRQRMCLWLNFVHNILENGGRRWGKWNWLSFPTVECVDVRCLYPFMLYILWLSMLGTMKSWGCLVFFFFLYYKTLFKEKKKVRSEKWRINAYWIFSHIRGCVWSRPPSGFSKGPVCHGSGV